MRSWLSWCWSSTLRRALVTVLLAAFLTGLAWVHACACTGGRPSWRPLDPAGAVRSEPVAPLAPGSQPGD